MSVGDFKFECDRCEYTLEIDYLPREYLLPDGRRVRMMQRHVWCNECNTIRPAEGFTIPETERNAFDWMRKDVERRLQAIPPGPSTKRSLLEAELEERLAGDAQHDRDVQDWLALRTAPQRCLKCGNEEIVVPDAWWAPLVHGGCGGTLVGRKAIIGGTVHGPDPHEYTPDGVLLKQGMQRYDWNGERIVKPLPLFWGEDA